MSMTAIPRLNRLFSRDQRCLVVAFDHGLFGAPELMRGIESLDVILKKVLQSPPDALILSPGQAGRLQNLQHPSKPALIMRADVTNSYGPKVPDQIISSCFADTVDQALRWDATCIIANLLELHGRPELRHHCLQNLAQLKSTCERYGMPLMVETLVMAPCPKTGHLTQADAPDTLLSLVRQAVECGADLVKCDDVPQLGFYDDAIAAAGVPVLVRGGGKVDESQILQRTRELLDKGLSGIVYGRNVFQHEDPSHITKALMDIVHEEVVLEPELAIAN